MPEHKQPSSVNESSQQGGEARAEKWSWVEATVWTDRMLSALETGVQGGQWLSFLSGTGAVHFNRSPCFPGSVPLWTPLTGEPDAGDPHVRFGGGRGRELTVPSYPYHDRAARKRRTSQSRLKTLHDSE